MNNEQAWFRCAYKGWKINEEVMVSSQSNGFSVLSNGSKVPDQVLTRLNPSGSTVAPAVSMSGDEVNALEKILEGETVAPLTEEEVLLREIERKEEALAIAKQKAEKKRKEEEAKRKEEEEKQDRISQGYLLLSYITGGELPKSKRDHEILPYPDGTWDKEWAQHIPEINEGHIWDLEILEQLFIAHKHNKRYLITGPPGTGKTTSISQFCAWIKQPCVEVNGRGDMESDSILGTTGARGGETKWFDGRVTSAVRNGAMVAYNEIFKTPGYILMSLQRLLEEDGHLELDEKEEDKLVVPHPNFRFMATDNSSGMGDDRDKYVSDMQDRSTLDRFTMTGHLGYLSKQKETTLLEKRYPNTKANISKLVHLASLIRTSYMQSELPLTLSVGRGLFTMIDMIDEGVSPETAVQVCYTNKLADSSDKQAVAGMISTIGELK